MREPAYIAIDDEGYLTLYWGDGTEPEKVPIARGAYLAGAQPTVDDIEALAEWAWAEGYEVITPAYDLEATPIPLEPTQHDRDRLDPDEVDALLDDLDSAG
jgi:hypothetical protein